MTRQRQSALHSHDFHELFWVDAGEGWHLLNGERTRLGPGVLVLIRADDTHGFEIDADKSLLLTNVAFPVATWSYLSRRYGSRDQDVMSTDALEREFQLGASDVSELDVASAELLRGARDRRAIERFLLNVFYLLDRVRASEFPPGTPDWLVHACQAIREQRHFQKGTSALVALAGHSAEHVAREVRRWLDKTPTDVVNDARLAHAATRLAESDTQIVEVGLECGYENISHFYRLFRERYGVSPGRYRQRQQQIVPMQRASV
jgi:AraC family cel operon transcriptional repressor